MTQIGRIRIRGPQEVQSLWERIGTTSEKVLRWLLRFAHTDLSKQSEGQWLDFQEEFREFLDCGPPGTRKKLATWPNPRWGPPQPRARLRVSSMWRNTVESCQRDLRSWLEKLVEEHSLQFEPMPITLHVYHPRFFVADSVKDSQLFEEGGCFPSFPNDHQVFAYHVAHVLGAHSGRLRRCTECRTIFLKDRRQQLFCSARCLNRVTQRRWRNKKEKERREKERKDLDKQKLKPRRAISRGESFHGKKRR